MDKASRSLGLLLALLLVAISPAPASAQSRSPHGYQRQLSADQTAAPTAPITLQPTAGTCTNLIQDSSFEAGTTSPHWQQSSLQYKNELICGLSTCPSGVNLAGPHTGLWWAWLGGYENGLEVWSLSQTVNLLIGTDWLLFYFWIGTPPVYAGSDDFFQVEIDTNVIFTAVATQQSIYPAYKPVLLNISNYANGNNRVFEFSGQTITGPNEIINFFLDDVLLCQSNKRYLPLMMR